MENEQDPGPRTKHKPFGFVQGDPLIVCLNEVHMRRVINAFGIRAHYVEDWNVPLLGHRYGKIIVFQAPMFALAEKARYEHWKKELPTHLGPNDTRNIYFV